MRRNDSDMDTRGLSSQYSHVSTGSSIDKLDLHVLATSTGNGFSKLDFALLCYHQDAPNETLNVKLQQYKELPIEPSIRAHILNLLRDSHRKHLPNQRIDAFLGRMFSDGIQLFCQANNIDTKTIELIATHTPDLERLPRHLSRASASHRDNWNNIINNETGRTVVSEFSVRERTTKRYNISPVAFVDRLLLRHATKFRACIHIDETVNIGFIPPLSEDAFRGVTSRDCGPGSLLIDYAMKYCTSNDEGEDNDGAFAAQGKANDAIVDQFLAAYDYRFVRPPLSIAREMFGDHEAQRLVDECLYSQMSEADTVATVTRVTAKNIMKQYRRLLQDVFPTGKRIDEIFICGPGARNSNIIDYLELELPEEAVTKPLDDIGIPGNANEAFCYAHLALEAVLTEVGPPSGERTSGESQRSPFVVSANIIPGDGWTETLERLQQFSQGRNIRGNNDVQVVGSGNEMKASTRNARGIHDRTGFPE